jgi:hypothetical protein
MAALLVAPSSAAPSAQGGSGQCYSTIQGTPMAAPTPPPRSP